MLALIRPTITVPRTVCQLSETLMTHLARKDKTWSSPVRLVVWDFDLTILSVHSWTENIKPEDFASRDVREDVADIEFFQKFVCRALERDVKVAVASFGRYEVIQAYLPGGGSREYLANNPHRHKRHLVTAAPIFGGRFRCSRSTTYMCAIENETFD